MQLHGFLSEKASQKKKTKREVTPGWTDISDPGPVSFLSIRSMYYIMLTLHNPINPLNVVSTNSFFWASNFVSPTTWCTNELRRLVACHFIEFTTDRIIFKKLMFFFVCLGKTRFGFHQENFKNHWRFYSCRSCYVLLPLY